MTLSGDDRRSDAQIAAKPRHSDKAVKVTPDSDVRCPKKGCGHWMRWSDRLDLFLCWRCKTKLSIAGRSVVHG